MNAAQDLKRAGLRITDTRCRVLEVFDKREAAISKNEIANRLTDIDRITLYRTLKTFEDKGLIHKAIDTTGEPKYARCQDCTAEHHHDQHPHFFCTSCEETVCLDKISAPEISIPKGFRVTDMQIAVTGVCGSCSNP